MFHERDMARLKQRMDEQHDLRRTHLSPEKSTFEKVMLAIIWLLVIAMGFGMYYVKSGGAS